MVYVRPETPLRTEGPSLFEKQSVGPTVQLKYRLSFFDFLTTPVAILNPDSAFLLTSDDKVHAQVCSPFFELGSLSP
jgi:hypothetical protein